MQQQFATPAGPLRAEISPSRDASRRRHSTGIGPQRIVLPAGTLAVHEYAGHR